MSIMPDSANAPAFSAGDVPDARQMSFGDFLNGALQYFITNPIQPQEMTQLKAFMLSFQQALQMKLQQAQGGAGAPGAPGAPGGAPSPPPPGGADSGAAQDYGAGFGGQSPTDTQPVTS